MSHSKSHPKRSPLRAGQKETAKTERATCCRLERALEDGFVGITASDSSARPAVRLENRSTSAVRVTAGALFDAADRRLASRESFLVPPRTTVMLSGDVLREVQRVRFPQDEELAAG